MCGRYTLTQWAGMAELLPEVDLGGVRGDERYNIAPSQAVAVVTNRHPRRAQLFRWGLIPAWATDRSIGNKTINARAESLAQKPAFREALERRRCLVLADGFFEWKKQAGAERTPMYIRMKDRRPFAFAGLWDRWVDPVTGEELHTCTIITTAPNAVMKPIHDRMPVILPCAAFAAWLEGAPVSPGRLVSWLAPYPAEEMEAYPVGRQVNRPSAEGKGLIAPVAASLRPTGKPRDVRQLGLFDG